MKIRVWTPQEFEYIRKNHDTKDDAQIAKELNRSESAVKQIRWKLGIKSTTLFWSSMQEKYLIENWKKQTDEELAKSLKKTISAIQNKRIMLNLIRVKGLKPSAPRVELPKRIEIEAVATGEEMCPRTDCPFHMAGGCRILKPPVGAEKECGFYPPIEKARREKILKAKSYRRKPKKGGIQNERIKPD